MTGEQLEPACEDQSLYGNAFLAEQMGAAPSDPDDSLLGSDDPAGANGSAAPAPFPIVGAVATATGQRLLDNLRHGWDALASDPASTRDLLLANEDILWARREELQSILMTHDTLDVQLAWAEFRSHCEFIDRASSFIKSARAEVASDPERLRRPFELAGQMITGPLERTWSVLEDGPVATHDPVKSAAAEGRELVQGKAASAAERATDLINDGPGVGTQFTSRILLATVVVPGLVLKFTLVLNARLSSGDTDDGDIRAVIGEDGKVSLRAADQIRVPALEDMGFVGGLQLSQSGALQLRADAPGLGARVSADLSKAELVARLIPALEAGPLSVSADIEATVETMDEVWAETVVLTAAAIEAVKPVRLAALAMIGTIVVMSGLTVIASGTSALALIESGIATAPSAGAVYRILFLPAAQGVLSTP